MGVNAVCSQSVNRSTGFSATGVARSGSIVFALTSAPAKRETASTSVKLASKSCIECPVKVWWKPQT